MSLIDNITRENGYRDGFIKFATKNIDIPAVHRWVSLLEDTRLGKPEAITNQKLLNYFNQKDRWIYLLLSSPNLLSIERLVLEYERVKAKYKKPNNAQKARFNLKALALGINPASLSSIETITNFEDRYGVVLAFSRRWKNLPVSDDRPDPARFSENQLLEQKELQERAANQKKDGKERLKKIILSEISSGLKTYDYKKVVESTRKTLPGLSFQFLDAKFTALPLSVWNKILLFSQVDKVDYIATTRDCDNFAIALAGECSLVFGVNGVGIVVDIAGKHAYNVLLVEGSEGLETVLVEPQTDGFCQIGDNLSNQEAYTGKKGYVIFA